jgi:hypothetical protein
MRFAVSSLNVKAEGIYNKAVKAKNAGLQEIDMTVNLMVTVNDIPINTDYFVGDFIDHTVSGMIESLEGTAKIRNLNLQIDKDTVTINLNGAAIPTNTFTGKIIKSTIVGMLSVLKGVTNPIQKVTVVLNK